jgi:putative phosphoesterase
MGEDRSKGHGLASDIPLMRLGVISDTHGLLRAEVFDAFAEVDHIVHAGDLGSLELLEELEALAPVTAVFGNTDELDVRRRLPQVAAVELEGFDLVVTHGDQLGSPTPEKLNSAFPEAQIIVYGHTHRPLLTVVDVVVTVMNPGSAGPRRFKLAPSVGILELEPGIPPRGRIVSLLDAN